PIRTRSAGKNLTRQKANPYPVRIKAESQLVVYARKQRLGNGINNSPGGSGVVNRLSIKGAAGNQQARYSIKGEGGPATITVNNLAPGTSANDIKVDERFPANPVKAELTFESKVSALDAIKKYNTALVDGYVLKVQLKQPGNNSNTGAATYRARGKLNKPPS
ncbi:12739_t:CDS:2, partial [Entrophospora sp. SA101]